MRQPHITVIVSKMFLNNVDMMVILVYDGDAGILVTKLVHHGLAGLAGHALV